MNKKIVKWAIIIGIILLFWKLWYNSTVSLLASQAPASPNM